MKESILFDFATVQDLESCKQIVARKLQASQVDCDDLEDLTRAPINHCIFWAWLCV